MNTENTTQASGAQSETQHAPPAGAAKAEKNTLMAILAYIGPLVIVSYLVAKDDPFVKFHIKQGLVLFVIELAAYVVASMFVYQLWMLVNLVNLGTLVLSIVGIINAVKGKEEELPLVGQFSKHFPI